MPTQFALVVAAVSLFAACGAATAPASSNIAGPDVAAGGGGANGMKCDGAAEALAGQLLASGQNCVSDGDCIVKAFDARCVEAFVCPIAFNRAKVAEMQDQATKAAVEHQACSSSCSIASCVYSESDSALQRRALRAGAVELSLRTGAF